MITFDGEQEGDLVKLGLGRRSLGQIQDLEEPALRHELEPPLLICDNITRSLNCLGWDLFNVTCFNDHMLLWGIQRVIPLPMLWTTKQCKYHEPLKKLGNPKIIQI